LRRFRAFLKDKLGVVAERYYLKQNGTIRYRPTDAKPPGTCFYASMRRRISEEALPSGKCLSEIEQNDDKALCIFTDGTRETGDLLVTMDE